MHTIGLCAKQQSRGWVAFFADDGRTGLPNQQAEVGVGTAVRCRKAGVEAGQQVLLLRQPKRENYFSPFDDKANPLSAEAQAPE